MARLWATGGLPGVCRKLRACPGKGVERTIRMQTMADQMLDAPRLADAEAVLEEALSVAGLPRFAALCDCPEGVRARLAWRRRADGRIQVDGRLRARLAISCHRCLEPVKTVLESDFTLVLAHSDAEATEIGSREAVVCVSDNGLDWAGLIEDELLLALPQQPCQDVHCARAPAECPGAPPTVAGNRPFATLGSILPQAPR